MDVDIEKILRDVNVPMTAAERIVAADEIARLRLDLDLSYRDLALMIAPENIPLGYVMATN